MNIQNYFLQAPGSTSKKPKEKSPARPSSSKSSSKKTPSTTKKGRASSSKKSKASQTKNPSQQSQLVEETKEKSQKGQKIIPTASGNVIDSDQENEKQEEKGQTCNEYSDIPINQAPNLPPKEEYPSFEIDISSPKYDPKKHCPFQGGYDVPFEFICEALDAIQTMKGSNSRKMMLSVISNMFCSIIIHKPNELIAALYFLLVKLSPDYVNLETGVGSQNLTKAIAKLVSLEPKQVKKEVNAIGDLGKMCALKQKETSKLKSFFIKKSSTPSGPITLKQVFKYFYQIAGARGSASIAQKESIILQLLEWAKGGSKSKYIVRFLGGGLKIKVQEKLILSALARSFAQADLGGGAGVIQSKLKKLSDSVQSTINKAVTQHPNYDHLVNALLKHGVHDLQKVEHDCRVQAGVPMAPMLAKPTKGIKEILKRFEGKLFTCEYKYDGFRGQIHYYNNGSEIRVYSRNLSDLTSQYPDIAQILPESVKKEESKDKEQINNFILDCEIVAFDRTNNKMLPFGDLQSRSRKAVTLASISVQVCLFPFDLLYLNGESLLEMSLDERRGILRKTFTPLEGKLQFAKYKDADNFEDIDQFLQQSIRDGCEGLMVKTLKKEAEYLLGKRSFNWLKLKKDYLTGDAQIADSLDLVPVGALLGTGKRANLYGSFLLACYDSDMEQFQTVCKIGTGFSDQKLKEVYDQLKEMQIPKPAVDLRLGSKTTADSFHVWFKPSLVWEVKGADLQFSPVYTCAIDETGNDRGIGLRFPRFLRSRDDKEPRGCTTSAQIFEMYKEQPIVNLEADDDD